MVTPFAGAVLTGGASTRMGRDKALVEVDGVPMARRVAQVLAGAGAAPVLAVGGDVAALRAAGLDARPDPRQGTGPLGGLLTALELTDHELVAVTACDLAHLSAAVVADLARAAADDDRVDVAMARTDRLEPLCAVWRRRAAQVALLRAFASGERAVHRALGSLRVVEVPVDPLVLRNINHPGDLLR